MRPLLRYAAPALLVALVVAGCGSDDPGSTPEPTPAPTSATPSDTPTSSPSDPPGSENQTSDPSPSSSETEGATDLLDWRQVPGSVEATVTRSGDWTLTVSGNSARATLAGPDGTTGYQMAGRRVSDALIDGDHAVVVLQDRAEQRPSIAEVTDLESGQTFTLDGTSGVPTTTGGSWALGELHLQHATVSRSGAYCLATVDLESQRSTRGWCAAKRQGFSSIQITDTATSMLTFTGQPSCRTPVLVSTGGAEITPLPDVTKCQGWDSALFDGGAIWTIVPKERQAESARVFANDGDEVVDLGPASTGTLVWCDDAAYFSRDPQRSGDPATLMRWAPGGELTVAYESPPGQAFLDRARCGGDDITVTALSEGGDEQVTARVS